MTGRVTRYQVLREMLDMAEAHIRRFGRNGTTVEARPGCEVPFAEETEKAELIRQMMREVRYGVDAEK